MHKHVFHEWMSEQMNDWLTEWMSGKNPGIGVNLLGPGLGSSTNYTVLSNSQDFSAFLVFCEKRGWDKI
jgi:hypothetical protein